MKTMKIEKHLFYTDEIKQLIQLDVHEQLQYAHEEDGVRATGPLHIQGTYETQDGRHIPFREELQMDVLAPAEKLGDTPFALHVESFEGTPDEDGIQVMVLMNIVGLKEEQKAGMVAPKAIELPVTEEVAKPIIEPEPIQAQATEEVQIATQEQEPTAVDEFEDLFEDADTTYTSYRMIVAKPNDTYASIANRYEVKEADLRTCNHNKQIDAKTLVILP